MASTHGLNRDLRSNNSIWRLYALAAAANVSDFSDRRAMLRHGLTQAYESGELRVTTTAISAAIASSPYIGNGRDQVSVRPTFAGLRDALPTSVIALVLAGKVDFIDVLNAIEIGNCAENKRSTTGVTLGLPDYDAALADDLSRSIIESAGGRIRNLFDEPPSDMRDTLRRIMDDATDRAVLMRERTHMRGNFKSNPEAAATTATVSTTGETEMPKTDLEISSALDRVLASLPDLAQVVCNIACAHGIACKDALDQFTKWVGEGRSLPTERLKRAAVSLAITGYENWTDDHEDGEGTYPEDCNDDVVEVTNAILRGDPCPTTTGELPEEAKPMAERAATPVVDNLSPDAGVRAILDGVLASAGLPNIDNINASLDTLRKTAEERDAAAKSAEAKLAKGLAGISMPKFEEDASLGIPKGTTKMVPANVVFDGCAGLSASDMAKLAKIELPFFEWDHKHPNQMAVDPNYIFRFDLMLPLLYALLGRTQPWVQGHTGSGKTTLVEQIAARLNWPMMRVNFDSEITRMDLVGRDTLTTDPSSGATVTKWVDGVLPQALRGPFILLLDEIDFVRPDVSYVLQRMLEGNGLMLNENGGEWVRPDPLFRLVATGNTVGQGDEFGMYQGARPQSSALLDRFSPFIRVPYMDRKDEEALIGNLHPTLPKKVAKQIMDYVTEHRESFVKAHIMMPISPRGVNALADSFVNFYEVFGDEKLALRHAFTNVIANKANATDRAVILGLMDRVGIKAL